MKKVLEIGDRDFLKEVLDSEVPVLVDFYASWCPPCKRLAPILEQLATDYGDKVKIVKLNTDHEQIWANKLGVKALPTIAFYQHGRLIAKESGLIPYQSLAQAFDILLGQAA